MKASLVDVPAQSVGRSSSCRITWLARTLNATMLRLVLADAPAASITVARKSRYGTAWHAISMAQTRDLRRQRKGLPPFMYGRVSAYCGMRMVMVFPFAYVQCCHAAAAVP